jgi:hypothetical protein
VLDPFLFKLFVFGAKEKVRCCGYEHIHCIDEGCSEIIIAQVIKI